MLEILPYTFRILHYLSGVMFSVDRFVEDELLRTLFVLNPFYGFLTLVRAVLLDLPAGAVLLASVVAWTVPLVVVGFWFFRRGEAEYGRG